MADASPEQLQEYEKQLADVTELIKASPGDESLLSLQSDLRELVALTRETLANSAASAPTDEGVDAAQASTAQADAEAELPQEHEAVETAEPVQATVAAAAAPIQSINIPAAQGEAVKSEPPKKKAKKIKEFEIPPRLIPLETDSEAEKNRKRRAVKALKRQHKAAAKEVETEKKKSSWQSFQKKKKLGKESSIFSTHDGESKIGVVSGRQKTSFNERTRHK